MRAKPETTQRASQSREGRAHDRSLYLASLIDNISDALISTDLQFKVLEWNAAAESLYGWTAAEVMGHPLQEFVRNEYLETTREVVIQAVSEQGVWRGEVTQNRKDGSRFPVLAAVSLVKDPAGQPVGFVAINRDISERKQAEEALREGEQQYKGLFETSPAALYLAEVICDAEGRPNDLRFLYVNPAFERFAHLKAADIVGRTALELFPQGNRVTIERQGRVALTGIPDSFEGFSVPLNAYFETTVYAPRHGQCVTFLTDITERKQAEKQIVRMKRLYATLSQVNQTIVRVRDRADLYQSICEVATKFGEFAIAWIGLLNAETGDITPVAANGVDLAHWPFPHVNVNEGAFENGLIATALRTSQVVTSEDVVTDERTGHLQTSFVKNDLHSLAVIPFQLRGAPVGILKLISHAADLFKSQEELLLLKEMGGDISFALETLETEAERQQAGNKLRENISRLELAMQSANMAWWEMNLATGGVTFSERKAQMLGYPPEQFKHYRDFMALVHPEDADQAMQAMRRHIEGIADKYEVEYRILTKAEGYKWFYDLGSIVERDSKGTPLTATGLVIDITERKRAETALRESEQKFSSIFEKSVYATTLSRLPDGVLVDVNEAFEQEFGYTRQEAIGKTSLELGFNPDAEGRARMLAEIKERGSARNQELHLKTKSNGTRIFSVNIDLVDIDGQKYILNTTKDITEQKRAEADRDKLIERLNLATHAAQLGIWDWDIQKNELVWDDRMYALYGLKPGDFGGAYEAWLNGVHPDDRESSNEFTQQTLRGGKEYDTEFRVVWPDGSVHCLKANGQVFRDEAGRPIRMVGVNYDITARKQAEERLRESEQLFSKIFTDSPVAMSMTSTTDGINIEVNDAWCLLTGYSREEAIGHNTGELKIFSQEERQRLIKAFSTQGYSNYIDSVITTKSGERKNIVTNSELVTITEKRYILASAIDITERKQAEANLEASERKLKLFVEYAPAAIAMFDRDMQYIAASRRFLADYNLKDENLLGRSHYEIFPEISERWKEIHRRCLAGATEKEEEDPFPRADGTLDWVRWEIHPWQAKSGEIGGIILFSEVITARKLAELEIKHKTEDLLLINALNEAANRGEEMDAIAQMFARETRSLFNCENVNIYLTSPDAQYIEMQSSTVAQSSLHRIEKLIGRPIPKIRIPLTASSFFKELLAVEQGTLIRDKKMLARWLAEYTETTYLPAGLRPIFKKIAPQILKIMPIRSVIMLPLMASGQTIGLMDITSRGLLTDEIHQRARRLSAQVTAVLLRQQAEKRVQLQLRRLRALSEIDRAISSGQDMRLSLEVLLNEVLAQLEVDAATVLLLNPAVQELEYFAGKGFRAPAIRQSKMRLGAGLAGQVGLEQKVLHIPDLARVGAQFVRRNLLKEDEFVEYFGVPLSVKGKLKGVLEIFHRAPLDPDPDWLNYLETLGGQAAIAIDNAQLFEDLQRSNAELEQRVAARTADLSRLNAELEHANRAKDEFLATMSHELRTPLTGILGLSEAMQFSTYGPSSEKQLRALKSIEASGRHLLALINDILDLSKIEAGKFDIHPEMVNLEDTCQASLLFIKELAQKKSITVDFQRASEVKTLLADPRRLKQILVNLLGNAVKFTPEKGQVTLAVRADAAKGQVYFSVTDTGIGIAAEDLAHLFTPFTQVDTRLNRQYEGTGLGLVLAMRLTEMHGGSLRVESEVGRGSCFTVSLPWQVKIDELAAPPVPASVPAIASAASAPNSRGCILLADDNETNLETFGDYLQFLGYQLLFAGNGMEALVKAEESTPQLIIMDIQMPVMDGLEAIRRLRADPRFAATPIIALTALAMAGDRERCLAAGANEYLSKPVSLITLKQIIATFLD